MYRNRYIGLGWDENYYKIICEIQFSRPQRNYFAELNIAE